MQTRNIGLLLASIYVPALALLGAAALAAHSLNIPFGNASRDLAAIAGTHPLAGFISNIGILLWCATATVCLCAAYVASRVGHARAARFLMYSGLFTAVLLIDDFFLVHEQLAPSYLGIPERAVIVLYGISMLVYALSFRAEIRRSEYWLLFSALSLFAVSVLLDMVDPGGKYHLFFEDGAKLLGLANWLAYYLRTAQALVIPEVRMANAKRVVAHPDSG